MKVKLPDGGVVSTVTCSWSTEHSHISTSAVQSLYFHKSVWLFGFMNKLKTLKLVISKYLLNSTVRWKRQQASYWSRHGACPTSRKCLHSQSAVEKNLQCLWFFTLTPAVITAETLFTRFLFGAVAPPLSSSEATDWPAHSHTG